MVDVSYQMVLSTLQTVALIVGIIYYVTIMRNSQESRKREILWSFMSRRTSADNLLKYAYALNLKWKDYDDFVQVLD